MKPLPHLAAIFALACFTGSANSAEVADVRKAVDRSLPYLQEEGVSWMKGRACITCHQIPSMIWSHNEAQRRGVRVDKATVQMWNRWAFDNAMKKSLYYKLTEKSLSGAGLADDVVEKLKPLKEKNFVFESDFREAATKALGADGFATHGENIVKLAALPNQGGGGGGTNNQFTAMLLSGAAEAQADSAEARKALVDGLVKAQSKDGSWPAASQFVAQQRPTKDEVEASTRWTLLALMGVPDKSDAVVKAIAKTNDWLKTVKPTQTTETLMLRALVAAKNGDAREQQKNLDELLKLQHDDGGWGWLTTRAESDPLTTGEVLYALAYMTKDTNDTAIRKATKYLLSTQNDKGIWPVTNKGFSTSKKKETKDGDYIYTYWATGWATIGLLQTLEK